ncbi:hypothetical protein [Photorhabdus hindustanensis]|uniref:Uncharacterized protein n=1 Tax=Photorhabdus hindustanensis TaxID=2918802 RepID=A0A2S8PU49_9GAMM|nr:hypothetical protein [Photorhabdus hindustanensis]PQQ22295.1 hypothetical protein C6H66_24170 [Photorhabdus hindustanensis]
MTINVGDTLQYCNQISDFPYKFTIGNYYEVVEFFGFPGIIDDDGIFCSLDEININDEVNDE